MASGSSTPTPVGSFSEADGRQAGGGELLRNKGVKPQGKKAQKCKQVALVCTAEEVQAFRQAKEAEARAALGAKKQKREPGQLSMEETVKRMRMRCTHDFVREFPSGPRDNGEYHDVCRLRNAVRE